MNAGADQTTSPNSPVVEIRSLSKVYHDLWRRARVKAVQQLDLEIFAGEVLGLLGPNGSGKTTTLKMLVGLLQPTAGSVSVMGNPPRSTAARKIIGYLPEESPLYPFLTARETLELYGRLFDLSAAERHRRLEQLLIMTGLEHVADRPVGQYSRGMARRVGLAQALINSPKVIVLDEPTAGLDPLAARLVKDIVRALADNGCTVILSSHLLADVEDICDRIAVLYNGRLQALGEVDTLLAKEDWISFMIPAQEEELVRYLTEAARRYGGPQPRIEHPRRNLEDFFLELIHSLREKATEPISGAGAPGLVAEYLKGNQPSLQPGSQLNTPDRNDW